ncbi:MAG TPA: VWA domain-containing protein [Chloroflexota bacterium]|nr:VWA domain-containing protein [Chloroflexota bacterium]
MSEVVFLDNVLLFTHLLRQAGFAISPQRNVELAQALTLVDVGSREQVYHAARSLLVTRREQLHLFEAIFNQFWRSRSDGRTQSMPPAPRHKRQNQQFNIVTYMAYKAQAADQEVEVVDKTQTFSNAELLQQKLFSEMAPEELETIKRLIQEMRWQAIQRQSRRRIADKNGDTLRLRQAMRTAVRTGGVPLQLSWQSRKIKQRPFVLIADISGSMEKYGRLLLQFFYAISHSFHEVECFVFGTRLTRITHELKLKNIDRAVDEAARQVVDWSGGTRIGESLRTFNRQWSRRVLRRGAIVLIVSDGWERGNVSMLRQEMAYLQRRSHRLIWLNPLLGQATYQPLVEGMAAALPYIDDFLPVHNLQSLTELSHHLGRLNQHRSVRPDMHIRTAFRTESSE